MGQVSAFPRTTAPRSKRLPAAIQASPPGSRTSPTCQRRRENASAWRRKDASGGVMTRAPRGALVIRRSVGLRLAGVGPGQASTVLALPEAIALPVHLQDVDVEGEAIEERAGQALGSEHGGPLVERQIAGDDDRAPLVALAEHLEQQLGTGW